LWFTEGNISKPKMNGEIALRNLLTDNKAMELRYFGTSAYRINNKRQKQLKKRERRLGREVEIDVCRVYKLLNKRQKNLKNYRSDPENKTKDNK